jgi:hypothetical protein
MHPKDRAQMMAYLTRPGKIKVAQLDNVNTPDLDQTPDSILRPGETLEDFDVTFRRPNADGGRIGFYKGELVTDGPQKGKYKVKFPGLSIRAKEPKLSNFPDNFFGTQFGTEEEINKLINDRKQLTKVNIKTKKNVNKIEAEKILKDLVDDTFKKQDFENFKLKLEPSKVAAAEKKGKTRIDLGGKVPAQYIGKFNKAIEAGPGSELFKDLMRITGRSEADLLELDSKRPKSKVDPKIRSLRAKKFGGVDRRLTDEEKKTSQQKVKQVRKGRLETAVKKAGEGVADINKAQDETIALLNKFYKDNPKELLGNTKLRNLLDLTLKDGELVKKNKYVTDEDFLKLIKEKKGLFTIDHVDEVQFEKLSTEFPIFKQLATYNTNSGLIKSIKSYVVKNQNSTDPVVQDKIKKQIAFLEDLKLRIDTPTGRIGSKKVLAAVDREAGVLPNFLAQLRALNIKLPGKAKAALLGIGGGLGLNTFVSAGPIEETGPTAMDTAKTIGATGTGAAAVGTKTGRNILGKAFRTLGTRAAGAGFAANQIKSNIQSGENIADAVVDPLVGLELSFPGLFKENVAKITKNPTAQRILNLAIPLGRAARFTTPVGAALGIAGLGVDAYKASRDRLNFLNTLTPDQKTDLFRKERQQAVMQNLRGGKDAFNEFAAAEGGVASGPPPVSGPNPQGLPSLLKRVKKL